MGVCLVALTGWLTLRPSASGRNTDAPVAVTVDARQTFHSVPRAFYGLSLSQFPSASELPSLAAQGASLIALPLSAPDNEKAWLEQQQKLSALLKFAEEQGLTIVLRASHDDAFVKRLLEVAPTLKCYVEIDARYASQVLKEEMRSAASATRPPCTLLLRDPPTELIASLTAQPSSLTFQKWRCGFSFTVARLNDERLSKATARLKQVDPNVPLFAFCRLPGATVSLPAGAVRGLQQLAEADVAFGLWEMPLATRAQRTLQFLGGWGQLYGNGVSASSPAPIVTLASRQEDGVSVCLANDSRAAVQTQLNLYLPPGVYRVETRKTNGSGPPSMIVEKSPFWVNDSGRAMPLALDLPPRSLIALKLTHLPLKARHYTSDLIRQVTECETLQERERARALDDLRDAQRAMEEKLNSPPYEPESVRRTAHRTLLQIGRAEAVFLNEVEQGRVETKTAQAVSQQFRELSHILSTAGAAGLGLRLDLEYGDGLGVKPVVLPLREPAELSMFLTNTGALPINDVEVAIRTDDALSAKSLDPIAFTQLSPGERVECRFQVRRAKLANRPKDQKSQADNTTPLPAQIAVSYYADRCHARLWRSVEFYQE
jgi:hypothetical protein